MHISFLLLESVLLWVWMKDCHGWSARAVHGMVECDVFVHEEFALKNVFSQCYWCNVERGRDIEVL